MTAPPVERAVFDVLEAGNYLHMGENEVRRLLKTGELRGWRTRGPNRGDWRISRTAADEWIAAQEQRGALEVAS